jgi:hypothetical protein
MIQALVYQQSRKAMLLPWPLFQQVTCYCEIHLVCEESEKDHPIMIDAN